MNGFIVQLIEIISSKLSLFLIVETRLAATFMLLFFLRREWCPPRILICLSLVLNYFILATVPHSFLSELDSVPKMLQALINQFFTGILTGIVINIFAEFFIGFGQVISMQSGLGFVNFFVPKVGSITPLTHFFILLSIMIFFELNGHLVLIEMILKSFIALPVLPELNGQLIIKILNYAAIIFQGIIMLSLAIILSIMITNVTLGILTKFSPQLNVFSVGINLVLILCFFMLFLGFDFIVDNGMILCNDLMSFIRQSI